MGRAGRWLIAGVGTAVAFGVAVSVSGAFVLPPLMASSSDRWAVASGAGAAVAALVALWGQSWATRRASRVPSRTVEGERGIAEGSGFVAGGDRAVSARGDIKGIASTGDSATNVQLP